MAHGNLPGGGFSGFIKAEKPLLIRKRSYIPLAELPKDLIDEISKEEKPLLKVRKRLKDATRPPELKQEPKYKKLKSLFRTKRPKKTFDDQIDTEADTEVPSEPEEKLTRKKFRTKRPKKTFDDQTDTEASTEVPSEPGITPTSKKIRTKQPKKTFDDQADTEVPSEPDETPTRKKLWKFRTRPGRKKRATKPDVVKIDVGDVSSEFEETKTHRTVKREKQTSPRARRTQAIPLSKDDQRDESGTVEITEGWTEEDELPLTIKDDLSDEYPGSPSDEEMDIRVKFRRVKRIKTYTYYKRKRSLLRFCPCLDRLLHSQRVQYRGLKAMLGFPLGALFGFALYWFVLERMGAEHYLCWLLGILVAIGFAVSTQVRCICLLSIPACCGRAGRAYISTYVVSYIIVGPLANILSNAKESMRSISCTASLNLNHSAERFNLMFRPIKEIIMDFVGAGQKVQEDTKQLESAFEDIENEVRDEDEVREAMADTEEFDDEVGGDSRVGIIKKKFKKNRKKAAAFGEDSEKNYGMKSELRCEGVFTKGVRGCYDSFGRAYDRCHDYLPIIGYLLCWPMKLTFICDLGASLMGKRACNSDVVMNPGFGASVDTADSVQSEFDKDFSVQLQYKLTIPVENVDQLGPEDVSGAMEYSFERRKRNLDFFTQLVDRVLAILCLLVLNASRKYCNQYLRIIQFDNKYVTSYFRHIDARRRKKIVSGIRLISEVLTVSILLLFDRIFYEFLDLIRRHAHVTYKQTGVHHIKMTIYGDGFVGNMVRGILKGFDKKHSADQVTTTEECLPLPTKLPRELVIRLYLVFLLMLVLTILESYALRLRRVICSFFYPKREKRRIVFLYNDRLKKRRSFLQHMRHKVRKQAREQAIAMDSGVFFSLRKLYPKYFGWMSKLGLGLAQCLICSEKESKKFPLTACPECPFSYCSECLEDTEGKCYACLPDDDTEPSEDSLRD